jgi:CRP/FNR family transcriptional regulator, cyclic AMP receptor protein
VTSKDRSDSDAPRPAQERRSDVSRVRGDLLHQALAESGFADAHLAKAKPQVWAGILAEVPLFSRLHRRDLRRIAEAAQVARVSGGQVMVREGFSAEAFYVLLTGTATVRRPDGGEVTLGRGDFFGELGLLDAAPRTASVVASTDLWVMKLPRRSFFELIDREPGIARGLLETLASRLRRHETTAAAPPSSEPPPQRVLT